MEEWYHLMMPEVSIFSALLAGLLMFFAPCTLPLIPAFIGYLSSVEKEKERVAHVEIRALGFVVGFTIVFVLFGLISGSIGNILLLHRALLSQIGGLIIVITGLTMLGVIRFPTIFSQGLLIPQWVHPHSFFGALIFGAIFALGWSPCLGPILGTMLILAATTGHALVGAGLLFIFSLGFSIPFMLLAWFFESLHGKILLVARYTPLINKVGAIFFILIGIALVLNSYGDLTGYIAHIIDITKYDWAATKL